MEQAQNEHKVNDVDVSNPDSMKKTISISTQESLDEKTKEDVDKGIIDNTKGSDYVNNKPASDNKNFKSPNDDKMNEKVNFHTAKQDGTDKDVSSAKRVNMEEQDDMPKDYIKDNEKEGYGEHPQDKSTNRDRRARERNLHEHVEKGIVDDGTEVRTGGMQNKKKIGNDDELGKDNMKDKSDAKNMAFEDKSHDTHVKKSDKDIEFDRKDDKYMTQGVDTDNK